jgi:indole-3-glycerol phosphate synthase
MTILDRILADTRATLATRKRERPPASLQADLAGARPAPRFAAALRRPDGAVAVIAEHKRRSPSAGEIRPGSTIADVAAAYERGGAAAMSVLTEERHFDGSLEDLRAAGAACALPLLRKDFVVDDYQLLEARLAGADAVLLIVAALAPVELAALHEAALGLGLDVLVEVHDEAELEAALAIGPAVIGVNNRDLRDFSVDVERSFALRARIPEGIVVVSESGIERAEQLQRLGAAGVDAVLVGERLMRAPDPETALRELRGPAGQAR